MASIEEKFEQLVELKYQLYNGLFLTLPLDAVEHASLLLPILAKQCEQGLENKQSPKQIIDGFLEQHRPDSNEEHHSRFLFKVIQYVERQVVLLDALDDAAYSELHESSQVYSLEGLLNDAKKEDKQQLLEQTLQQFKVRVTLTAHPTQFYPGPVLAIISDLGKAIAASDIPQAKALLQQLGNTPFYNKTQPTPYDEAIHLSWYLSNIFYPCISNIQNRLATDYAQALDLNPRSLGVGFWPGGDRDGNPHVNVDTTRRVAAKLRYLAVKCYHKDIRVLKRRLSFRVVYDKLEDIEHILYRELSSDTLPVDQLMTVESLLHRLQELEQTVKNDYQGLYLDQLVSLRRRVAAFGFYFASLDIRQDSRIIHKAFTWLTQHHAELLPANYEQFTQAEKLNQLLQISSMNKDVDLSSADDDIVDTLSSAGAMADIQHNNGEMGCHRYIISNCQNALDVARVMALFSLFYKSGKNDQGFPVDVVPLFETVDDLVTAGNIMTMLYKNDHYRNHLGNRKFQQTVMLGFSDGTKDGGYLMANWAIYKAKKAITKVSRDNGIEVVFFDGRGGPPARGGGHTYNFYAAMGKNIESNELQLTVQGQTISSYYGTATAASHNLRQLMTAGLENKLNDRSDRELDANQQLLLDELASLSHQSYQALKNHDLFMPYLQKVSTLKYYGKTNIGSRPTKRGAGAGAGEEMQFEDLRAIPFVGAWAQLKQNVPGFYGLGTALQQLEQQDRFADCQALYKSSRFVQALVNNSMQSMLKSNFQLTAYLKDDEEFGEFWCMIHDEFELSKRLLLTLSGQQNLLEANPVSRLGIGLRQRVVLPLLVIQQYALMKVQSLDETDPQYEVYEKMVVRSLFGNINASRNAA